MMDRLIKIGGPPALVFLLTALNVRLPLYGYWDVKLMYLIAVVASLGGAYLGYLIRPRSNAARAKRFSVELALMVFCAGMYEYLIRTPATVGHVAAYVLGLYIGFIGTYLMSGVCLGQITDFLFTHFRSSGKL
jgi:hypothetical protein